MTKTIQMAAGLFCLATLFVLFGCRGKTGENGLTGPGSTVTTYNGTITSTYMTISAPVVTADSMIDVRLSSETNKWVWADYDRFDVSAKTVSFYATSSGMVGGNYSVLIQNPD